MSASMPNLVKETGPRFLGYLLHWGLFGVLSTQVYLYFLAFPKDPVKNKVFVYSSYVLEVVQTVTVTSGGFKAFGAGYGDPSVLDNINLTWFNVPLLTGLVAFIAQTFYAYRISILAQSYWLAGLVMFLAVTQLAGAIASAVVLKHAGLFSRLLSHDFSITAGVWNGGSALCDVIIAICMTYYLSKRRTNALGSTQVMVRRIITLVIETGTATAVVAILTLLLTTLPLHGASYFETPSAVLAKVYSNSMMVVLNSRMKIGAGSSETNVEVSTFHARGTHEARRGDTFELGSGKSGNDMTFGERSRTLKNISITETDEYDDGLRNQKLYSA